MSIRKFRPDIEVLRAIAVIAVVIAHSKIALPGGFIGVDIFFVISGFLITKHLHDEVLKTSTISLKSFYARRILRIFPASMLVLMLTLLGSFLFLSPLQLINYCWDALFASISGINYRLAITGTDYFQSTTTPSPFQHFWSLAVEEQFYLIWPLLILIFAKIFVRKDKEATVSTEVKFDLFKNGVSFLLILIIGVSLYLSYKITGESQMWAYFGLHTRAWQLAIGALIAFNLPLLSKIPSKIASFLSWFGFAGLVVGFTIISETTVYPGLWALLPTLATALIVVAGTNANRFSFESFFNCKISRWVGKISYSLYLIHWPIFVFIFYQLGENIKVTDRIAAIIISLMLAGLSLVLVENPVRFNKIIKSSFKLTYQMGLILILVVSGASVGVGYAKQKISLNQKLVASASNKSESDVFNKLQEAIDLKALPAKFNKPIEQVAKETGSNCIAVETIATPAEGAKCRLGDKSAKQTIVLLGDSHANQWTKAFDTIALQNNYQLIPFTKSGCSMTDIKHFNPLLKRDYTECYSYRNAALEEIAKIKPDIVVTTELIYQDSTAENYTAFIQKLQSISNQVIRLTDTPRPTQNIPECLAKNSSDVTKCSFSIENGNNNGGPQKEKENKIAADLGASVIDTTNWFCLDKVCPSISDNIIIYNDDSHVSDSYTKYLEDLVNKKIFSGQNKLSQKIIEYTKITNLPNKLITSLDQAPYDTLGGKCIDSFEAITPSPEKICTLGDTKSLNTIVLLGDSHAQQWIQALDPIAQRNGYKLITFAKPTCSLADLKLYDDTNKKDYVECTAWRKEVLDQVEKIHPNILISSEILHPNSTVEKYSELMVKLKSISGKVIKIFDTPKATQKIPECLVKNNANIQKCSFDPSKAFLYKEEADKEVEESKKLQIPVIETLKWFCTDQICPPIVDNIIVFYDNGHVSSTYSKYLSDVMEKQIFSQDASENNKLNEDIKLTNLPNKLVTPLDKVFEDRPQFDCISSLIDIEIQSQDRCFKKFSKSNKTIALIGDSHAYQWSETFAKIAQDEDYNLLILTKPGCPTYEISVIDPNLKRDYTECYTWRQRAVERLEVVKPDIIITTGVIYDQSTTDKYTAYIKKLQSISKKVVSIVDSRKPTQDIPECLAKNSNDIQKCSFSTEYELSNGGIQKDNQTKAAIAMGVNVIETSDWFCLYKICPAVIDNIVVYQDNNHVSNTYAKYLTKSMKNKLKPVLKK